jgi:hypothetical protein
MAFRNRGKEVPGLAAASVAEGNVARIHVHQEDAVTLEGNEDRLHFLPARAELVLFLRSPIGKHFWGEVGWGIEIGAGEIEVIWMTQSSSSQSSISGMTQPRTSVAAHSINRW